MIQGLRLEMSSTKISSAQNNKKNEEKKKKSTNRFNNI